MELNSAFGLAELSPRKEAQAKINSGGVEAEALVFKTKLLLFAGLSSRQIASI
jgi:hypothetical protein